MVIDTNVLISALLSSASLPAHLILLWREGRFEVLTSVGQLDELIRVTRYPKVRERLAPALAGRLINELRDVATMVRDLPVANASPDPDDNAILSIAVGGAAEFLITGDKRDLLFLKSFQGARIVTVREFLTLQGRMP